ncbi:MAG: hypothetical protein PSX80_09950 [bacterium]|nr:hypothetical protein [bacterium]
MLLAIVAAVLAYQKAKASGRNPWLWAFIGVAVYIGVQLLIGVAAGMLILVGIAVLGWSESAFTAYELPINIVAIIGALAATWGLLKFLDRVPAEEIAAPPPPPPTFSYQEPTAPHADRPD